MESEFKFAPNGLAATILILYAQVGVEVPF